MSDSCTKLVEDSLVGDLSPTTRLDYTDTKRPNWGYTTTKIIKSGSLVETYDYEKPIRYGSQSRKQNHIPRKPAQRIEEYNNKTIIRAINRVRRLTHLNFTEHDKFLTLTFNNDQRIDINNLQECLPYFQKFIRKLRKRYPNLLYICVPEFQKRGAVHYHVLCNIPYIQKADLQQLWLYGFSKPKAIKSTTNLALYLCKYLTKRFKANKKKGHKLFYSSRGLKQPIVLYGDQATQVSHQLFNRRSVNLRLSYSYQTERNGATTYVQYCKIAKK